MLKQTVVYFDIFVSSKHSTQCLRGTKIPEVSEYTRRDCLGGQRPKLFPLKSRNCVCTVIFVNVEYAYSNECADKGLSRYGHKMSLKFSDFDFSLNVY